VPRPRFAAYLQQDARGIHGSDHPPVLPTGRGRSRACRKAESDKGQGTIPSLVALPRGGVPVAYEVAKALERRSTLLMVRKIGCEAERNSDWVPSSTADHPILSLTRMWFARFGPQSDYIRARKCSGS